MYCPHFFTDGYLFEGDRFCTKMQKNVEKELDLEEEVSQDCPLQAK